VVVWLWERADGELENSLDRPRGEVSLIVSFLPTQSIILITTKTLPLVSLLPSPIMFSRIAPRVLSRVAASSKPSFSPSAFARPSFAAVARPSASLFRSYGAEADDRLTVKNVEIRILDIFRTFDKVNQDNVSPTFAPSAPCRASSTPHASVRSATSLRASSFDPSGVSTVVVHELGWRLVCARRYPTAVWSCGDGHASSISSTRPWLTMVSRLQLFPLPRSSFS
jgi:hypothetical protein